MLLPYVYNLYRKNRISLCLGYVTGAHVSGDDRLLLGKYNSGVYNDVNNGCFL